MRCKFPLSLPPAAVAVGSVIEYADQGEPVIPWYMPNPQNMFLSVSSFKFSPYATVHDTDLELDDIVKKLMAKYPGIPMLVHENYVTATALAAAELPVGAMLRPIITATSASFQIVNKTTVVQLWTEPPTKARV